MKKKKLSIKNYSFIKNYYSESSKFFIELNNIINSYYNDDNFDSDKFTREVIYIYNFMKKNLNIS